MNYVPSGRRTPDYGGESAPGQLFHLNPEISLGLTPSTDIGIYLPMQVDGDGNRAFNGPRLRFKWLPAVAPDGGWFYGVNFELSANSRRVTEDHYALEMRNIIGWRNSEWLIAVNPILGFALSGENRSEPPDLMLAIKVARQVNDELALGIEHYAGVGPINDTLRSQYNDQTTYLVLDYESKGWGVNFGVGRGSTALADNWVVKAIIGIPLR
jgi:hypothetical protein